MLVVVPNAELTGTAVSDEIYNLANLIKDKRYFKNLSKPSCIVLILTNRRKCFQYTMVIQTGLSNFYKVSITVLKKYYHKQKFSIVLYRQLSKYLLKFYNQQKVPFKKLKESVSITLRNHAPLKKRYVRANQSLFKNKSLSNEIIKGSHLRSKFLSTKSDIDRKAYSKQPNYTLLVF